MAQFEFVANTSFLPCGIIQLRPAETLNYSSSLAYWNETDNEPFSLSKIWEQLNILDYIPEFKCNILSPSLPPSFLGIEVS